MKQVLLALLLLLVVSVGGIVATNAAVKKTDLTMGGETDLSLLSKNIKWTPDGHITYITFPNGNRRFFISGNQRTYTIDAPTPMTLQEILSKNPTVKENFGPDENSTYKNHYATITSVIQTEPKNLLHLMAFTQFEQQAIKPNGTFDTSNFTSSIGLLESYDGGNTWKDFGPIIRGDDYIAPGTKITGAGEPSAIVKDGYIYIYFVDWASGNKVTHADQIYLARTKIFPDGGLGIFEYLTTEGGFSTDIMAIKPVISAPDTASIYASLPSVSYNKYLNQYLAIFETNVGFYQTTSSDGLTWNNPKLILSFIKPQSTRETGDVWVSYPTLLSDQAEKTDGTTSDKGNLYFGKGIWPNTAHQLTVKPFEFK